VSGPYDFAVRAGSLAWRTVRVHRIQPRVRDDRDTPLHGVDANNVKLICIFCKQEFMIKRKSRPDRVDPVKEINFYVILKNASV
jgi:hypothetical protein